MKDNELNKNDVQDKTTRFMRGLNEVDEDLIQEAEETEFSRKGRWNRTRIFSAAGAIAACMAIVLLTGTVISQRQTILNLTANNVVDGGTIAMEMEKDSDKQTASAVGVTSEQKLGDYKSASGYGEIYQLLKDKYEASYSGSYDMTVVTEEVAEGAITAPASNAASAKEEMAIPEEAAAADDSASNGGYSTTNVMTENVDESDIVKTDGAYIYMAQSGTIKITDIRQGAPGESVSVMPEGFGAADRIEELYVSDGKMVIITSHQKEENSASESDPEQKDVAYYGYYSGWRDLETICYVYDLTDAMNPTFVGSMTQDGAYHTSRKVGDVVYLFTDYSLEKPELSEKKALKEENLSQWLPSVNGKVMDSGCIYIRENGYQGLAISSFGVDDPDKTLDAKCMFYDYCDIYVSQDHIYLYEADYNGSYEVTKITSLGYKDGMITAGAAKSVLGTVQDSFAICQRGENLCVLTTSYSQGQDTNTLFMLDQNLDAIGRMDDIARGERIYAARFLGNIVYFITYRNMDPLFAVDLSNPKQPKLLGELEISGFSDYLHVWDDNHILGIGYETDSNGTQGIKLVMFDCSDPTELKVENSQVLRGLDYSSAFYNYKEILADPNKNLIGFGAEDYDNGGSEYNMFTYDKDNGFTTIWNVELETWDTSPYRGLYVNDYLYLAGGGEIRYQKR